MNRIVILGESHVRIYGNKENIFPVFINSGEHFCLTKPKQAIKQVESFLNNFSLNKQDIVLLQMGEPAARIQLNHGLYPHYENIQTKKVRVVDPVVNKEFLTRMCENYISIGDFIKNKIENKFYILSPTGCYPSLIPAFEFMNNILKTKYSDFYIDIFTDIIDKNKTVKHEYMPISFANDPLHLGTKVTEILLEKMKGKHIIDSLEMYRDNELSHLMSRDFKNHFKYNTRFKCWVMENEK